MGSDVSVVLFDFDRYRTVLIPAVQKVRQSGETDDVSELISLAATLPWASRWADLPPPVLDEYKSILKRELPYSVSGGLREGTTTAEDMIYFVDQMCVPELIGLFIPEVNGFRPEQNMSRSGLPVFLYSQSDWIQEIFTFSRSITGPSLEYPFGEWSGLFSVEDTGAFDRELTLIAPPEDDQGLVEELTNLRSLVAAANQDEKLSLLMRLR
jgi:hypothetical protein